MEQSRVEKGLVFTWADLRPHQFRVGGQYSCTLFIQIDPSHGGDIVDVIVIPATGDTDDETMI